MTDFPKLNLPGCRLRFSVRGGRDHVWDPLRGRWLVCTPEEWVRRHVIGWLTGERGVPAQLVVQEYPVCICGMPQRADIVVMGGDMRPLLLVECKSAGVAPDEEACRQAFRYNDVVGARWVMVTNGLEHRFFEFDDEGCRPCVAPELA